MCSSDLPRGLNLDEWLHSSPPADIYVLGYVLDDRSTKSSCFPTVLILPVSVNLVRQSFADFRRLFR